MSKLIKIPTFAEQGGFYVVVESPRGSTSKLEYEPSLDAIVLSRPLPVGMAYPYDWGFVPSTLAPDGDPLDAMILWDSASFPGVVLPCRALGVIQLEEGKKGKRRRNDRLLAVPSNAPRYHQLKDVSDLSKRDREELERFFLDSIFFEHKSPKLLGWGHAQKAEALVRQLSTH